MNTEIPPTPNEYPPDHNQPDSLPPAAPEPNPISPPEPNPLNPQEPNIE